MASSPNSSSEDKIEVAEKFQTLVRNKLNADKIKLWLPPYTEENNSNIPEDLINRYASDLDIAASIVAMAMENLRSHALEKLAARKHFQETGEAVLHVKMAGLESKTSQEQPGKSSVQVKIILHETGLALKECVSKLSGVNAARLKVICGGKVIEDNLSLEQQQVKNQAKLLCICLSKTEAESQELEERSRAVNKTREAAMFLSAREEYGVDNERNEYFLQVADQSGKPIDLPRSERKALTLAMTLHEKGKAALKKKDYGLALLLLLEADKEFSSCRASILDAVDNYAILCLDIVWCHLCLKNIRELPDAENRLTTCDKCFRKSYGPNLERLALIKGGTGLEKALFMRLHLLQGILAYHQSEHNKALELLIRAQSEIEALQVKEDDMVQVMSMGFSAMEARLALRASEGSVSLAISHIMKKREEKAERKKNEEKEIKEKTLQRKIGKAANGQWVNTDHYRTLISMGFGKGAAAQALKQTNSDLMMSLQVLQEHPEWLNLADPEEKKFEITDEMLSQMTQLGFPVEAVRAALTFFHGDLQRAADRLVHLDGVVPPEWIEKLARSASSSSDSTLDSSTSSETGDEKRREKEAIESIIPDLPHDEQDHLDVNLDEEAAFLDQYLTLLKSDSSI